MHKTLRGIIYLVVLLTPLIVSKGFFFSFVSPKTFLFYFLIEIAFGLWLYGWLTKPKEYIFKTSPIFWSLVALLGVGFVSSIFGVSFVESFWSTFERMTGLLTGLHLLMFYIVTTSVFQDKESIRNLLSISVIGAVVASIFIWIGDAGFDWWVIPGSRKGATLGNTSFAGSYLLFNVFFAGYLLWVSRKTSMFWFWLGAILLMVFSPMFFNFKIFSGLLNIGDAVREPVRFLGESRAAAVSVGVGLLASSLVLLARSAKKKIKILGRVLLAGFGVVGVVFFALALTPSPVQDFLKSTGTGSRFISWEVGFSGALERPVLGYGVSNYGRAFQDFYNADILLPENGGESWFDKSHNILVDAATETGFIGLVVFLGVYVLAVWFALRKNDDKDFVVLGVLASGALLAHLIQGLTVFDMLSSFIMFYMTLAVIASLSQWRTKEVSIDGLNTEKTLVAIGVSVVTLVMLVFFVFLPMKSNRAVIKIFKTTDFEERLHLHEVAYRTPVGRTHIIRNVGKQLRTVLQQSFVTIKENSWEELALREVDVMYLSLQESKDDSADSVRNYIDLVQWANFYELFGVHKYEDANQYGEKAIELSPGNPFSYWALAQSKLNQGETEEALSLAGYVYEENPDLEEASRIYSNLKNSIDS